MKKIILSVFVLCLTFTGVKAQSFDLGLKLGANFASLDEAGNSVGSLNFENKTGLLAGAFVSVGFNDKFAIQPEILYSQQGAKTDWGDFNMDYVNIPVMFKFYIIGNALNIQAGPQFGFVVNNDNSIGDQAGAVGDQLETNDFDFSGAVGLGLDIPFGLRLSARYHFGFTDVANNIGPNQVVSVAVGYSFL